METDKSSLVQYPALSRAIFLQQKESMHDCTAIPDISHFVVYSGKRDLSKDARWPMGEIVAIPHTFPVTWEIEKPKSTTGFDVVVHKGMSPMVTALEARGILHTTQPGLFEEASLNFRGKLKPGPTIRAEVIRREVILGVEFEVIRNDRIRFCPRANSEHDHMS
jgi:hypothetical protein